MDALSIDMCNYLWTDYIDVEAKTVQDCSHRERLTGFSLRPGVDDSGQACRLLSSSAATVTRSGGDDTSPGDPFTFKS